jgi:ABC-type polysaccharide/polyol phosphate transport system ATPase subunit
MSRLLQHVIRRRPRPGADVFRLEGVNVSFRRNAIEERSLKHALMGLVKDRGPALHRALQDVTLTVRRGEHVGVIGRNGAGKSTLLRVLARVITPQAGRVYVDGKLHVVPLLELGIGFQADLSGVENAHIAGALMGYSWAEIDSKMKAIVEFAELDGFIHEPVKNYSSGMYARLAFALATDVEPEVLLVDEVFGVGDEFFMEKCVERMQRLMRAGTTTVFVSHNLDFLIEQCDRLIWLDEGRVVADGPAPVVAKAYRGARGTS